jgi:hypothetical protein
MMQSLSLATISKNVASCNSTYDTRMSLPMCLAVQGM